MKKKKKEIRNQNNSIKKQSNTPDNVAVRRRTRERIYQKQPPQTQDVANKGELAGAQSTLQTPSLSHLSKSEGVLQRQLIVTAPRDRYEVEADRIADRVMRTPSGVTKLNGRLAPQIPKFQFTPVRSLPVSSGPTGATAVAPKVEQRIQRMQQGGRPLDKTTRSFFEQRMGVDLSHIRVHVGDNAIQASRELQARAFTVGHHIAFNQGEYQTGTAAGKRLLAHELVHTFQQTGNIQRKVLQRDFLTDEERNYEEYAGQRVGQIGVVAAPLGVHLYRTPYQSTTNKKTTEPLHQHDEVMILATSASHSAGYYLVQSESGTGWVPQRFVVPKSADPNARLYWVDHQDTLEAVLSKHYKGTYNISTGNDFRTIMGAIIIINTTGYHINAQKKGNYDDTWEARLKAIADSDFTELRSNYQSIELEANTALWLPSANYIEHLKSSGELATRSDWWNGVIEMQKANIGFQIGIIEGLLGSIWDTLVGLYDLGKMIVDTLASILSGEIITQIQSLYETVKSLSVDDIKSIVETLVSGVVSAAEDFVSKWNADNVYNRWNFRGQVVGAILLEVLLAVFTGGTATAAKWAGKLAAKFPRLAKFIFGALEKLGGSKGRKLLDDIDTRKKRSRRDHDDRDSERGDREAAYRKAKMIAETNDAFDTPIETTMAQLNVLKATHTGVSGFDAKQLGSNRYRIVMRTTRVVDHMYTDGPTSDTLRAGDPNLSTAGTGGIHTINRTKLKDGSVAYEITGELLEPLYRGKGKVPEGKIKAPNYNSSTNFLNRRETKLPHTDLAHLWGPGFGDEAMAGIMRAPKEVNQKIQERIERYFRGAREAAQRQGKKVFLRAKAESFPPSAKHRGTERLKVVEYELQIEGEPPLPRISMELPESLSTREVTITIGEESSVFTY